VLDGLTAELASIQHFLQQKRCLVQPGIFHFHYLYFDFELDGDTRVRVHAAKTKLENRSSQKGNQNRSSTFSKPVGD